MLHAFNAEGLARPPSRSRRPHTIHVAIDADGGEALRELVRRSPRDVGRPTSVWTLHLLAEVAAEEGITDGRVSHETIRQTLVRLGVRWQRARPGSAAPTRHTPKKGRRDRLMALAETRPDWLFGFQDETWWSRLARPGMGSWSRAGQPPRLVEGAVAPGEPKALAWYGVWLPEIAQTWLRFVDGRPISALTMQFLAWCAEQAAQQDGITRLVLFWDHASWHTSRVVREAVRTHNQQVQRRGHGVLLAPYPLPSRSPWLTPIEPKWLHAKRRIVEHERVLSLAEIEDRVCQALQHLYQLIPSNYKIW